MLKRNQTTIHDIQHQSATIIYVVPNSHRNVVLTSAYIVSCSSIPNMPGTIPGCWTILSNPAYRKWSGLSISWLLSTIRLIYTTITSYTFVGLDSRLSRSWFQGSPERTLVVMKQPTRPVHSFVPIWQRRSATIVTTVGSLNSTDLVLPVAELQLPGRVCSVF